MLKRILLICLLCSPVAAWAIYKPMRVLAPQWVDNITCISARICIDDTSRYQEALALYEEALSAVSSVIGPFQYKPRVVFCASDLCFQSFGFKQASANTVGKSGIVISPRGWKPHYVRHEMIHHRQAEQLGIINQIFGPEWFTEGMAYSLSEDPRQPLTEPWQQHRVEFEAWYQKIGKEHLWEAASTL